MPVNIGFLTARADTTVVHDHYTNRDIAPKKDEMTMMTMMTMMTILMMVMMMMAIVAVSGVVVVIMAKRGWTRREKTRWGRSWQFY